MGQEEQRGGARGSRGRRQDREGVGGLPQKKSVSRKLDSVVGGGGLPNPTESTMWGKGSSEASREKSWERRSLGAYGCRRLAGLCEPSTDVRRGDSRIPTWWISEEWGLVSRRRDLLRKSRGGSRRNFTR